MKKKEAEPQFVYDGINHNIIPTPSQPIPEPSEEVTNPKHDSPPKWFRFHNKQSIRKKE